MFSNNTMAMAQIGWQVGCHFQQILEERDNRSLRQHLRHAQSVIAAKDEYIARLEASLEQRARDHQCDIDDYNRLIRKHNTLRADAYKFERQAREYAEKARCAEEKVDEYKNRVETAREQYDELQAKLEKSQLDCMALTRAHVNTRRSLRRVSAVAFTYFSMCAEFRRQLGLHDGMIDSDGILNVMRVGRWAPVVFANSGKTSFVPTEFSFEHVELGDFEWDQYPTESQAWPLSMVKLASHHEIGHNDLKTAVHETAIFDPINVIKRTLQRQALKAQANAVGRRLEAVAA